MSLKLVTGAFCSCRPRFKRHGRWSCNVMAASVRSRSMIRLPARRHKAFLSASSSAPPLRLPNRFRPSAEPTLLSGARRLGVTSRCFAPPRAARPPAIEGGRVRAGLLSVGYSAGRDRKSFAPHSNGLGPARLLSTGSVVTWPGVPARVRPPLIFRAPSQASGAKESTTTPPGTARNFATSGHGSVQPRAVDLGRVQLHCRRGDGIGPTHHCFHWRWRKRAD